MHIQKTLASKRFGTGWLVIATGLLLTGCAAQVHMDSVNLRDRAVAYYGEEIMDNLIRGRNGMLMLHVDITSLNADVRNQMAANFGGGQSLTHTSEVENEKNNTTGVAQVLNFATLAASRPSTFSLTPQNTDDLQILAAPVVDDPQVYIPYIQYLKLTHPGEELSSQPLRNLRIPEEVSSIVETADPRRKPDNTALTENDYVKGTLTKWGKKWYYVPIAYKQPYFELCLALLGRIGSNGVSVEKEQGVHLLPPKPTSPELQQQKKNEQLLQEINSKVQ